MVRLLHLIVRTQYADVSSVLHGQGNFELTEVTKVYRVNHMVWEQKTESEKDAIFRKFMRQKNSFLNLIARGLINMIMMGCVITSVGCWDLLMALPSGWVITYSTMMN